MRTKKTVIGCLGFALLAAVGYYIGFMMMLGDFDLGPTIWEEVSRVPSPSRGVEAVVVFVHGGATVSDVYKVYLVSPGKTWKDGIPVATFEDASRGNKADGVDLRWPDATHLVIEYWKAPYANLLSAKTSIGGVTVAVEIRSGVCIPKAPGSGIAYNLRKSKKGAAR